MTTEDKLDSIFKLTNCKKILKNNIVSTKRSLISYYKLIKVNVSLKKQNMFT